MWLMNTEELWEMVSGSTENNEYDSWCDGNKGQTTVLSSSTYPFCQDHYLIKLKFIILSLIFML